MKMPVNKSGAIFAALLIASCSQGPTAPTDRPTTTARRMSDGEGFVQTLAAGDVKNGPIEIDLVRVTQTNGVPLFFAAAGGTYTIRPGREVEIYIQIWTSNTALAEAPRLIVDWGVGGGVDERDRIHCGPCRVSRTYNTEGRYAVTVTMDDRVGGTTSRPFALIVQEAAPESEGFGTFAGSLDISDPTASITFDGPNFAPPSTGPCNILGFSSYYDLYSVFHAEGRMRIQATSGSFRTFLGVFKKSYNFGSPCQNIVAIETGLSFIDASFPQGNYVVVVTSYDPLVTGPYTLVIQ